MTRVILTVGCVGKSYCDATYCNVYDFDKHTLDYKYDRTGFENLSEEAFKGLPNRKINDDWFDCYMLDWCDVIDSGEYDVVTGWLQEDCLNYLLDRGYDVEIILVDLSDYESVYKKRSQRRGNNEIYWQHLQDYCCKTLQQYGSRNDIKVVIFDKPYYLSEYLLFSGTALKFSENLTYSYVDLVKDRMYVAFEPDGKVLRQALIPYYTQLVLTGMSLQTRLTEPITGAMVHDAWAVAYVTAYGFRYHHSSLDLFDKLPSKVQKSFQKSADVLNAVAMDLAHLQFLASI